MPKANPVKVRFMVAKWNSGVTKTEIARLLGMTKGSVCRAIRKAAESKKFNVLSQEQWEAYYGSHRGRPFHRS